MRVWHVEIADTSVALEELLNRIEVSGAHILEVGDADSDNRSRVIWWEDV